MTPLNPDQSRRLIAATGGCRAFAAKLGIDHEPGNVTRVDNWRVRGIPVLVQLQHKDTIARLARNARRRGCVL